MIRIIRTLFYIFLIPIITFILVSCSSGTQKDKNNDITYNKLISELKNNGYKVDEIEVTESEIKHSFFSVPPYFVDVNGERISVYEFSDIETTNSQAETISEDGCKIGNSFIEWVDKPHFYKKGKLIVGYAGSDNQLLKSLKKILGESITK